MSKIVGESFDGAANMRGAYNGVQKFIKEEAPNSVYIWCYAHVLNLSATDIVENILEVKNLIGLLQATVTFFSESCKRMNVWTDIATENSIGPAKLRRLQKVGATRWWSKQAALERVLGSYGDLQPESLVILLQVLYCIKASPKFDSKATFEANALLEKWCTFNNLVTAILLLHVYSILRAASEYLQTRGLDCLSAWNMVQSSKEALGTIQLEEVYEKSMTFAHKVNERLVELELDGHFAMDSELKTSRVARKKQMPGEEAPDSRPDSPLQRFRVEVFRRVIDQICTSITERFSVNQDLIKDTACLDPRRFKELLDHGIPGEALEKISKLTGLKASDLRAELLTFIRNYDNLSKTLQEEYSENTNLVLSDDESDDDQDEGGQEGEEQEEEVGEESRSQACTGSCRHCLTCCYKILYRYSLNASAFSTLFLAYEYLLTLSFSQVSCERAFSKLKLIKTRLRSSLSNEKLESCMLMCSEKDIVDSISVGEIIAFLTKDSLVYSRMLL